MSKNHYSLNSIEMKRYILNLLLVAFAISGLLSQTPVANYSFSGNANDDSEFKNHASVNGANLTADRFGWANSAFIFDGKQSKLTASNADQLNSPTASISFWVNVEELPAQGEGYLISFGGWQERFKISLPSHGKLIFTTNHTNGITDMDAGDGNELVPGVWNHVVMVHDGSKDLIYFNGILANEQDVVGDLNSTTRPLGIGFDAVDNANYFAGTLDEVMIFNTALSAVDIGIMYDLQSLEPAVPQDIVASYSFEEFGKDGSRYGNNADISSAKMTTDRFGFGNSSLLLDGVSSAVVAGNANHMNSDFATIGFWVNVNSLPGSGEVYLLSFGGWQERWKISLPAHGKPVFTTYAASCCNDVDSGDGNELTPGQWVYVVMVHDGTSDKIFMNGALVNEKAYAGALNSTNYPLGIGFDPIDLGGFFDGQLDDIEIYNYALTDQEIADRYTLQSTFPGTVTDLVAEYKLNGNGLDATQFQNDAILMDGASAISNRHNWGANALNGAALAENSIALQSDFTTISFWVNPTTLPGSGEVYLLSNGGWQDRWKISLPSHGKPVFTTKTTTCCNDVDSGDGNELPVGMWTHATMVHDGTTDKVFINGVLANEKAYAGPLNKTKYPLGIGFDPIDNGNFFDGSIDDVQIYDRALSDAEVADLYNAQKDEPVVADELVANYTFDKDAGDNSEFHNDAFGMGYIQGKDRFGLSNKAAVFEGTSAFLAAANSPQLMSVTTTLSYWVNVKELPASGEVYLLSNGGWQERWKVSLPSHGKPVFTTHAGGNCCTDLDSGDGNELVPGQWAHVAMVHDGTSDIIYMNGVKVNETAAPGDLDPTVYPLGIGFDPVDNQGFFNGSLDEVQLYNRALTDQEIMDLYLLQSTPPTLDDTESPDAPQNLSALVEFTTINLSWTIATDNVGVTAYNVYQDGALARTMNSLSASFSDLIPLTDYVFGVSAIDADGNESLITTLKVTSGEDATPDITPPSKPGNLDGEAGANSVLITWDASTDDRAVAGYVILVDGLFQDSVSNTTLSAFIKDLETETSYTFEVYAFDAAGNDSEIAEITLSTTEPLDTGELGLVAHYPFDGDANDATPYDNHGAIGGDPVFEESTHPLGAGGQNIKFDGDGDSVLVNNAIQLISDFATVSFWIRVDGQNPSDGEAYILNFGNWDQRWKISLPSSHLKIVWTTNGNNVQFPSFISDMDSGDGNEMVIDFWWYVTMVHDGEKDLIYVNGDLANSKPVDTKLNSTARDFGIGNNSTSGGQYFIGGLDNVKLYNRALSAEEVTKLYTNGTTGIYDFAFIENGDIKLTPNPTSDILNIDHSFEAKNNVQVRILDNMGRQWGMINPAINEIKSGKFTVNVHNYPTGLYYVNFIVDGKNIGSLKFNKI
jgi:chitodextrinase